ncbi:phosphoribosylamine--glycine ligase [Candidatus Peregrinibacteria bacterium]|nr:phosphoribosylamine--glycine ligase [Candidatus Peregrinibacteria bacterium]
MKILLVGNGAREHVIAETLRRSKRCSELLVFANKVNPGMEALASLYHVGNLADMKAIQAFGAEHKPDFAVLGPDNPIADGAADVLAEIGIPSVGPKKSLARLESSKGFTRALLEKYKIVGNPRFRIFKNDEGLEEFVRDLGPFVVKTDGLTGGKGVKVMGDHFSTAEEGLAYAKECLSADGQVVIEEKLTGQEFSLMSFCDGEHVVDMPPVQDHKRAYDGDLGPNTGGMGSYSSGKLLPFLTEDDLTQAHAITVAVANALRQECGEGFKGVMYGGFIAVKNGVRLIEYNARFGDPEAMNVLPLLQSDFAELCLAIVRGTLTPEMARFSDRCTVCKYAVPEGYPEKPKKGERIRIKELPEGVSAYYAAVDKKDGQIVLSSSRAMAFVGIAPTLSEAERLAQKGVECVDGPIFYRRDIGTEALIGKRVEMMKELRG